MESQKMSVLCKLGRHAWEQIFGIGYSGMASGSRSFHICRRCDKLRERFSFMGDGHVTVFTENSYRKTFEDYDKLMEKLEKVGNIREKAFVQEWENKRPLALSVLEGNLGWF